MRAPYQKEIMDAVGNPSVDRVVMMTAAQVGKTELLLNVIGFHIDQEPSAILLTEPTLEMGEAVSKDRIAPMVRDTPALQGKIKDPRSRDSGNTLLHKIFPGGHITIAGANSPASLASRPIRILLCDEVDRYPASAGTEGDPVNLAIQRTSNFWNRRIVLVSTPTIMGMSRIEKAYEAGTKERWCIPCPVCGSFQPYDWERMVYKDLTEPLMKCLKCGALRSEKDWKSAQFKGIWIPDRTGDIRTRSFHLNAFASPWTTWKSLVEQYEEAYRNGEEQLKVWWNTKLGLPWENQIGAIETEILENRRERYEASIPDGVLVLTCGVDTQDDRLEAEVVGWGVGKESWGIEYRVFYGDPGQKEIWSALDDFLSHFWSYADGEEIGVSCTCIDSAGHHTDDVYRFCKPRSRRNIFAIVGRGDSGKPSVNKPSRNNRRHVPLFTLGVSTIKGSLFSRLKVERPGPGYCHFPVEPETNHRGYDAPYFKGLVSERMVVKRVRGKERIEWEPRSAGIRNEPLDVRVYATGALEIFNPDLEKRKERRTVKSKKKGAPIRLGTPPQPTAPAEKKEEEPKPVSPPPSKKDVKKTAAQGRGFRILGRGIKI
jgi:phage terminase large subunit GpA-like protein